MSRTGAAVFDFQRISMQNRSQAGRLADDCGSRMISGSRVRWIRAMFEIRGWFPRTRLHLQIVKIWVARLHRGHVHFDEVILDPAFLRSGEEFLPIDRALSDRHLFLDSRRPVLEMQRTKPARILRQIRGGLKTKTDY